VAQPLFAPSAAPWDPRTGVYQHARLKSTNRLESVLAARAPFWVVDMTLAGHHLPAADVLG
jgi:hypothetical protein